MSMNPDRFEPVRLEYYNSKMFSGQNIRGSGKAYRDLKAAYQIAFLVNRRCFKDKTFLHKFEYYDPAAGITLGGRTRIITVELSKLQALENKAAAEMTSAERWAYYFRYLTDKDKRDKMNEVLKHEEGIAMASQVLIKISRDEIERARLLSEYKYEVDTQSKVVDAKREGRRKGRREGRQKGRRETILENTRNALQMGLSMRQIEQITGIPADKLLKLLNER